MAPVDQGKRRSNVLLRIARVVLVLYLIFVGVPALVGATPWWTPIGPAVLLLLVHLELKDRSRVGP